MRGINLLFGAATLLFGFSLFTSSAQAGNPPRRNLGEIPAPSRPGAPEALQAKGSGAGNGQLFVNVEGEWIPLESALAYDTRLYRGVKRLPDGNPANGEEARFNKDYRRSFEKWMRLLSTYNPALFDVFEYQSKVRDIIYVNREISFPAEAYPDQPVDYKRWRKAAVFFKQKIYVSIPNMEAIGSLQTIEPNQLSVKENQGYVLLHEIINASFSRSGGCSLLPEFGYENRAKCFDDNDRLLMGQQIIEIRTRHWTREQYLGEAALEGFPSIYTPQLSIADKKAIIEYLHSVDRGTEWRSELFELIEKLEANPEDLATKVSDPDTFMKTAMVLADTGAMGVTVPGIDGKPISPLKKYLTRALLRRLLETEPFKDTDKFRSAIARLAERGYSAYYDPNTNREATGHMTFIGEEFIFLGAAFDKALGDLVLELRAPTVNWFTAPDSVALRSLLKYASDGKKYDNEDLSTEAWTMEKAIKYLRLEVLPSHTEWNKRATDLDKLSALGPFSKILEVVRSGDNPVFQAIRQRQLEMAQIEDMQGEIQAMADRICLPLAGKSCDLHLYLKLGFDRKGNTPSILPVSKVRFLILKESFSDSNIRTGTYEHEKSVTIKRFHFLPGQVFEVDLGDYMDMGGSRVTFISGPAGRYEYKPGTKLQLGSLFFRNVEKREHEIFVRTHLVPLMDGAK